MYHQKPFLINSAWNLHSHYFHFFLLISSAVHQSWKHSMKMRLSKHSAKGYYLHLRMKTYKWIQKYHQSFGNNRKQEKTHNFLSDISSADPGNERPSRDSNWGPAEANHHPSTKMLPGKHNCKLTIQNKKINNSFRRGGGHIQAKWARGSH